MPSYNLGKIKGDRGERGEKGDRGIQGEKGEKGERGAVPTLSVKETNTLPPGENAYVNIENAPEGYALSFNIPRGKDGQGSGNMHSDLYDTLNKREDIFKYAEKLFSTCLHKNGGILEGEIICKSNSNKNMVSRNIAFCDFLPTVKKDGDLCFLMPPCSSLSIKDIEIGSSVILKEHGKDEEYLVCNKDYDKMGAVSLIRRYVLPHPTFYERANLESYYMGNIDMFLQTYLYNALSDEVKKYLSLSDYHFNRSIFIPSATDIENMKIFSDIELKKGKAEGTDYYCEYWLRSSTDTSSSAPLINRAGSTEYQGKHLSKYIRPVVLLENSTPCEASILNNKSVYNIQSSKKGIYISENGVWKEFL